MIFCIGELLVDFFAVETEVGLAEAQLFQKEAGGAPANVAAAAVALGSEAIFCGKVGADAFGDFLVANLQSRGVDTRFVVRSDVPTTMAFVSRTQDGERDFSFVRGADALLTRVEIKLEAMPRIAHFGSATALLDSPFYETYVGLMQELRAKGVFISFDPNYRADLWRGREEIYKARVAECARYADFVKLSEEEYALTQLTAPWLAVTKGEKGVWLCDGQQQCTVPSITVVSVDSTGAGDAFVGAMLTRIEREGLVHFDQFQRYARYSNIVGALTCTQVGAMTALPTREGVRRYEEESE